MPENITIYKTLVSALPAFPFPLINPRSTCAADSTSYSALSGPKFSHKWSVASHECLCIGMRLLIDGSLWWITATTEGRERGKKKEEKGDILAEKSRWAWVDVEVRNRKYLHINSDQTDFWTPRREDVEACAITHSGMLFKNRRLFTVYPLWRWWFTERASHRLDFRYMHVKTRQVKWRAPNCVLPLVSFCTLHFIAVHLMALIYHTSRESSADSGGLKKKNHFTPRSACDS